MLSGIVSQRNDSTIVKTEHRHSIGPSYLGPLMAGVSRAANSMTTNFSIPRRAGWWLIIIGLAAAFVINGVTRSLHQASPDPNDILHDKVVQGIQDNVSKLSCAVLVWSSERSVLRPGSEKPEPTENYTLWWKNNKIAISRSTNTIISDPNGQVSSNQETRFIVYDGNKYQVADLPIGKTGQGELLISKEPPSDWYENNYLQIIGWQGYAGLNHVFKAGVPGIDLWSTESTTEDSKLIEREFRESKTPLVGCWRYDLAQGGMLVSRKRYYKQQLQTQKSIRYAKVTGGAWFPVSVITEQYNVQNGELISRSRLEIDIENSVFNDPSALPEDVFEIKIGPNAKVEDLTSLKTRLKRRLNDF